MRGIRVVGFPFRHHKRADLEFDRLVAQPQDAGDGIGTRRGGNGLTAVIENFFYSTLAGRCHDELAVFAADVQSGQVFRVTVVIFAAQAHVDVVLQLLNIAAVQAVDGHIRAEDIVPFEALVVAALPVADAADGIFIQRVFDFLCLIIKVDIVVQKHTRGNAGVAEDKNGSAHIIFVFAADGSGTIARYGGDLRVVLDDDQSGHVSIITGTDARTFILADRRHLCAVPEDDSAGGGNGAIRSRADARTVVVASSGYLRAAADDDGAGYVPIITGADTGAVFFTPRGYLCVAANRNRAGHLALWGVII